MANYPDNWYNGNEPRFSDDYNSANPLKEGNLGWPKIGNSFFEKHLWSPWTSPNTSEARRQRREQERQQRYQEELDRQAYKRQQEQLERQIIDNLVNTGYLSVNAASAMGSTAQRDHFLVYLKNLMDRQAAGIPPESAVATPEPTVAPNEPADAKRRLPA